MTTVHHTPITTGAAANAATINAPLSEIDTKLGAAKTSGHIIYADASGNLAGGATLYRHPTSGNIIIGDASPTDITGATLQVAGSVVVSDGAGATKLNSGSTYSYRQGGSTVDFGSTPVSRWGSSHIYTGAIATGTTFVLATAVTVSLYMPGVFILEGFATYSNTKLEQFALRISRALGQNTAIAFTSIGAPRGTAWLSAADFTATDDGTTISVNYTNVTGQNVSITAKIDCIWR